LTKSLTSRRQFMQSGFAVSTASLVLPQVLRAESGSARVSASSAELFIYDERFAESVEAAQQATAGHIAIASTAEVMNGLWYDELDLRWKEDPMTLAGMTTERSLFVFETLALDRGMRVVSRTAGVTEDLVSWVIGPRKS